MKFVLSPVYARIHRSLLSLRIDTLQRQLLEMHLELLELQGLNKNAVSLEKPIELLPQTIDH